MHFYVNIVHADPHNDVRGVWSEDMLREAIQQTKDLEKLLQTLKGAKSTAEKLETIKALNEYHFYVPGILMEDLEEQLRYMTDPQNK